MKISPWLIPALFLARVCGYGSLYLMSLTMILIHETAHAMTAKWFDIPVRQFYIGPLGARLWIEAVPMTASRSLVLYVSGPLSNGILAMISALGFVLAVRRGGAAELNRELWRSGCLINCCLAVFNLLPVYPLDGGKLLLEILRQRLEKRKAFRILYIFSGFFAVSIFFLGIYLVQYNLVNFMLCIISVVFWIRLIQERRCMAIRCALESQL